MRVHWKLRNERIQSVKKGRLKNKKTIKNLGATVKKRFSKPMRLLNCLLNSTNMACHLKTLVPQVLKYIKSVSNKIRKYSLCCFHCSHITVSCHTHTQKRRKIFYKVMLLFYNMYLCVTIMILDNYTEEIHSIKFR